VHAGINDQQRLIVKLRYRRPVNGEQKHKQQSEQFRY
jgi:hypothetical protein